MFATIARIVAVSSLGAAMGSLPGMAAAADTPSALAGWTFGYAPYTYHFSEAKKKHDYEPDDEKHSYVWLLSSSTSARLPGLPTSAIPSANPASTPITAGSFAPWAVRRSCISSSPVA